MRFIFTLIFLCALGLTTSGCGLIGKKLESPKVDVQDVAVSKIASGKVWLDLTLKVKNPNKIDFTVDELEYALEVNDKLVVSDKHKKDVRIAANKETLAVVPIQLKLDDIVSSALTLLTNKTLPYRARGKVKIGPFKIPFDEGGQLDISDL